MKRIPLFALIVFILGLQSCETDFSLNGEYQTQPVVFGLLDHTKDFHTVKITKAYLGDGDNLVYAQNPDSNYFDQVNATITEYDILGDPTGREWTLFDTVLTGKDTSGIFYAPDQKVYAFFESDLDSTMEYELNIDIDNGAHMVSGRTTLIPQFKLTGNILNPQFKIRLAQNTVVDDDDYETWIVNIIEGLHAARYNWKYTLRWRETYADMSTADFSATRNNGDEIQSNPSLPGSGSGTFLGKDFYEWVAAIVVDDPDLVQRKVLGLDLQVSVAHEDLEQFIQVSQPVSGIAQVQPEYTNLTNSRGLFSSRIVFVKPNLQLDEASTKHLCEGGITGSLLFCSSYAVHSGELWYCP